MAYSKYGAKAVVTADGQRFDSQREYARWRELELLEHAGKIAHLRRQVRYPLNAINGEVVAWYVADFIYEQDGKLVMEDTKGFKTPLYRLKRKWIKAEYGIEILET